ncbi:MAG: hypothetical protein QW057_08755 [Candidatus Bathyarchaeia archaeon]
MSFPNPCAFEPVPVAHWVWGVGGWLRQLGALDFAGDTVVHINVGVAALAAAFVIGKRRGFGRDLMLPHNIPYVVIGTALLRFGWFTLHQQLEYPHSPRQGGDRLKVTEKSSLLAQ